MVGLLLSVVFGLVSCCFVEGRTTSPLGQLHPEFEVVKQWYRQFKWQSDGRSGAVASALHSVHEFLYSDAEKLSKMSKISNVSLECVDAILSFGIDTARKEPYALQVLDADGKPQSGILNGNIRWNGRFFECQKAKSKHFTGKWCDTAMGTQIPVLNQETRIGLSMGICLPASCSEQYITDMLQPLANETGVEVSVSCPEQPTVWTATDIVSLTVFSILLALLVFGTVVDMFLVSNKKEKEEESNSSSASENGLYFHKSQNQPMWMKVAVSFSIIKNTEALLNTVSRPDTIDVLHGLRFFSIAWVVLGHSYVVSLMYINNGMDLMNWCNSAFSFQIVSNATFSVDTFFFLSGLLVTYLTLRKMDGEGFKLNVGKMYLLRYIRLTPPYAFSILFVVGFFGKLGSGPMWPEGWEVSKQSCDAYWWTNLLYINNLHPSTLLSECFALGWYLANDMQFFLLAPISIFLLHWRPKIGLNVLAFGIFSSVLVTGIISSHYKALPQTVGISMLIRQMISPNSTANSKLDMPPLAPKDAFWSDIYAKPWCRISVYLVGMITGYILHVTKGKIRMSKPFVVLGWIISACLSFAVMFGLWPYISSDTPMTISLAAFYNSMSRPVWSVALAWVVIACVSGYGGPVSSFLSWKLFTPLSRLTYCIYLSHWLVIIWWHSTQESTTEFSNKRFAFHFLATLTFSIATAYLLSMLAEAPFINLIKLSSSSRRAGGTSSTTTEEPLVENEQLDSAGDE